MSSPKCHLCGVGVLEAKRLIRLSALGEENPQWECYACSAGVWERANDVICVTASEFDYWIKRFRDAGREADAVILEAQRLYADAPKPTTHNEEGI